MTAPAFHPLPRSPDFQGKQGHASRFARKGSKLRLVWPGYDDTEVVEPDEVVNYRAQAGLRVGGGSARKHCPLVKIETPSTPPFSPPTGAALVHRPVRFSPSFFERSSRATAPPLCVTAPGRLYLRGLALVAPVARKHLADDPVRGEQGSCVRANSIAP